MIRDVDLNNYETHISFWDDDLLYPHTSIFPDADIYPQGFQEISNIVSGSMKLTEIIADKELRFGAIYASKFEVQVFNLTSDISGKMIQVYQLVNGEYRGIFFGKIESCQKDNTGYDRTIVAYDMSYYYRDVDVSDWWVDFWHENGTATLFDVRKSLLEYMGIESKNVQGVNDYRVVRKNVSATYLSFNTVLSMTCELNGFLPHFNRDGILEFINLSYLMTKPINLYESTGISGYNLYEGLNSTFEDYITDTITGVEFYDSEGELKYVVGDITNTYKLSSNIFCYDMSTFELKSFGESLLLILKQIKYTPATVKMIVGDLSYTVGSYMKTSNGNFFIFENQYSAAQLVEQTMICRGEQKLGESSRKLTDEMLILNEKYSRLTFNVETFKTEFGDYQQEVSSMFEQTAEHIVSEVARGTKDMQATYQGAYKPTYDNYPANEWTDDKERAKHVGATFYNTAEGRVYRWTEVPNAVALTFDPKTKFDKTNTTLQVYSEIDGKIYSSQKFIKLDANAYGGYTLVSPGNKFYIYWNGGPVNLYGFSLSVHESYVEDPMDQWYRSPVDKRTTIEQILGENHDFITINGTTGLPESEGHFPYNHSNIVWKWNTEIKISKTTQRYMWVPQEGYAYSRIEQTADMIQTEVNARKFSDDGLYADYTSKFTQTAEQIAMKVSKGTVSSELSLEPDEIHLKSGRLIIDSGKFQLDRYGQATMEDAILNGEIEIGKGKNLIGRITMWGINPNTNTKQKMGTWDGDGIRLGRNGNVNIGAHIDSAGMTFSNDIGGIGYDYINQKLRLHGSKVELEGGSNVTIEQGGQGELNIHTKTIRLGTEKDCVLYTGTRKGYTGYITFSFIDGVNFSSHTVHTTTLMYYFKNGLLVS